MKPNYQLRNVDNRLRTSLALAAFSLAVPLYSQTLDSFNPDSSYPVPLIAVQTDGKVLVGGTFGLGGQGRGGIGRLNADGTVDPIFNPGYAATPTSMAVQADGKILVGGSFTTLGGQACTNFGRLNADGTLDTAFNSGANGAVCALALQPDGKILVGGNFTKLAGTARNYFGRLNADGTVDDTFNPGASSSVYALALQADGKVLVAGTFTNLAGAERDHLGRVNSDGMLDNAFNPGASSSVRCLVVQADGKILAGGAFTNLAGVACSYFGRLNANGTLDAGFNPAANKNVYSICLQADGRILVGGSFTSLGGLGRSYIGRFNANGTVDTSFNPGADSTVYSIAVQVDGAILVGGKFTNLAGVVRNNIGRFINTAPATQSLTIGSASVTWLRGGTSPEVSRTTFELSTNGTDWTSLGAGVRVPGGWQLTLSPLPPHSSIRARGYVASCQSFSSAWYTETIGGAPVITSQPVSQERLPGNAVAFTVTAGGTLPINYQWRKDGVNLTNGGNITGADTVSLTLSNLLSGNAGSYSVVASNAYGCVTSMVAVLTMGYAATNDPFNASPSGPVYTTAIQTDGRILVGGTFGSLGGSYRTGIGRLNSDCTLDTSFSSTVNSTVYCLAVQPDGRILVGGNFSSLGGAARSGIGRLNADGTLDAAFNPGAGGTVYSLIVQPDGKILVGGAFTSLGGQMRTNVGRLNADGTLDTNFNAGANRTVFSLACQPDGKILLGGLFTTLSGQTRNYMGRLNADGSLDSVFNPDPSYAVYSLAVQPDGKILVAGNFLAIGEQLHSGIARLSGNGIPDPTFNPNANDVVYSLAVQTDGKILVGGCFTNLVGQARKYLGRLNSDGTLDGTFNPGADGYVYSLGVQADGRILAGGAFYTLSGQSRSRLGRLSNTGPATQSLSFDGSTIAWSRGGTSSEVWRTSFEACTNGTDWVSLGSGQRVPGGWRLSGVSLPSDVTIRARGSVAGGDYNGSGWFVETVIGPLVIFSQPISLTNNASTLATFTVSAAGAAPLSYQWLKNGTNLTNSGNISGAQTPTLMLANVIAKDQAGYSVVISNAYGTITSLVATLTVSDPCLFKQPVSQIKNAGTTASFSVSAGGTPPMDCRWYKDATRLEDVGYVSGAGTTTLTLSNVLGGDAGGYSIIVSNVSGAVTSSVANLYVYDPAINSQPTDLLVDVGQTAMFSVAASGTPPLSYQWRRDGMPVADATGTSLTFTNTGWAEHGRYDCVVSNIFGSVTSAPAMLAVNLATLDSFNPVANGYVSTLAVQADGKILAGGDFTRLGSQARGYVGRLNEDGSLDPTFNGSADYEVNAVAVQSDGRILIGGGFTNLGGHACQFLGRLNTDGTWDSSFRPAADNWVAALALQADGGFLAGGWFTKIGSQPHSRIARFRADGTLDTTFNAQADGAVKCIAVQPDGKILVGGYFSNLCGQLHKVFGRLNSNGTLDATFNPVIGTDSANLEVGCVAVQPDGKILLSGTFNQVNGISRYYLARLNSDGTLDGTFNPGANVGWGDAHSFAIQADGKIVLGGEFTELAGQTRNGIARLNADGTLDEQFNSGIVNSLSSSVFAIALAIQPNGKILVGGYFTAIGGQTRWYLGRLNSTGAATQSLACENSRIIWRRAGNSPELWCTTFEATTNGVDWFGLGGGTRIPGGWQSASVSFATNATVRARGLIAGGDDSSGWFVESTFQVLPRPAILANDGGLGFHTSQFGFNVQATPGQAVIIEASTNFVNWVPLQTNITTSLGQIIFCDAKSGLFPRRFYRAGLYQGPLPPPAILTSGGAIGFQTNRFGFSLAGVAGQTVIIETSTNLLNWTGLATNILGPNPLYFNDPGSADFPQRFYRARAQ